MSIRIPLGSGRGVRIGPHFIVVLLILGLAGAMATEPTRQLIEQRDTIATMRAQLRSMEHSNDRLQQRIEKLQDADYLERQAREQAGLVYPGETSVVVMPPASARDRKIPPVRRRQQPPPEPGLIDSMLSLVGLE